MKGWSGYKSSPIKQNQRAPVIVQKYYPQDKPTDIPMGRAEPHYPQDKPTDIPMGRTQPYYPQDKPTDIPFAIAGKSMPPITSTERNKFVYSSDIDEYKGLRKDHPISIEKKKQRNSSKQRQIIDYRKSQLKLKK